MAKEHSDRSVSYRETVVPHERDEREIDRYNTSDGPRLKGRRLGMRLGNIDDLLSGM